MNNDKQRMIDKAMDDYNSGLIEKETFLEKMKMIEDKTDFELSNQDAVRQCNEAWMRNRPSHELNSSDHVMDAMSYLSGGWNARCKKVDLNDPRLFYFHDIGNYLGEEYQFFYYILITGIMKANVQTDDVWILKAFENCHRWETPSEDELKIMRCTPRRPIDRIKALGEILEISEGDRKALRKKYWKVMFKIGFNVIVIISLFVLIYSTIMKVLLWD